MASFRWVRLGTRPAAVQTVVRAPAAVTLLLALIGALAGCPSGIGQRAANDDRSDEDSGDPGAGAGGGASPSQCTTNADCIPAGPRCCDCPTHAVPADDPAQIACMDVGCGPAECGSPTEAVCANGACVLACAPVACDASTSCPMGFATDGNGCLTCACAAEPTTISECAMDSDCVRVRDDCCGCENGGNDTAVAAAEAESFDASLMCPANPSCPGGNACAPDLAPRCVQGTCSLVAGPLPPGACGRSDLPACPAGESCTVNASDQATMHGVGICQP